MGALCKRVADLRDAIASDPASPDADRLSHRIDQTLALVEELAATLEAKPATPRAASSATRSTKAKAKR